MNLNWRNLFITFFEFLLKVLDRRDKPVLVESEPEKEEDDEKLVG